LFDAELDERNGGKYLFEMSLSISYQFLLFSADDGNSRSGSDSDSSKSGNEDDEPEISAELMKRLKKANTFDRLFNK
jgi:hypothetical protein